MAWVVALAARLVDLDATMMLADSVGPYLSAAGSPVNPHAHAPPYGWGLHPPYAIALMAPSLRVAVGVTMGFHALAAPLAALCAARLGDWRHGAVAALVVALEPGLLDTAYSGAEGYLAILVGQQVPHRGRKTMTTAEVDAWTKWRQNCSRQAERGVGMAEYLDRIRQGRLRLRFSPAN